MPVSDAMNWDLDGLFPGGFEGAAWAEQLAEIEATAAGIVEQADALGDPASDPARAYDPALKDVLGCRILVTGRGLFTLGTPRCGSRKEI